jgi:hypothetical protein
VEITYAAPRENKISTDAFVLGFIWTFQTINPGKMQKVQSDQQLNAEYAYTLRLTIQGSMQLPFIPVYCPQK